jgi:hypothetical protein
VRKEDIISISDEESLGILLLCDDLVDTVLNYDDTSIGIEGVSY